MGRNKKAFSVYREHNKRLIMEAVEAARTEFESQDATEAELLAEICKAYLGSPVGGPLSGPWVADDGTRTHRDRECAGEDLRPVRESDLPLPRRCHFCTDKKALHRVLEERGKAATDGGQD